MINVPNPKCKDDKMKKLKLGYLALSKASWMTPKIDRIAAETLANLQTLDAEILYRGVTTTEAEAREEAERFSRAGVDAVILHSVTFPVGATIPAAARDLHVPILLLANPEEPGEGCTWEQNSFCGANMAAHGMRRLGKPYSFTFASPRETAEKLAVPLAAVRGLKALKELKVGLAGGRVPGFYTSNFDEFQLRREFGTTVEVLELLEVVETAKALTDAEVESARETVRRSACKVNNVPDQDLVLAARMFGAFRKLAEKYALNAYAIRCWPELSDFFGVAPCAVIGMLNDAGIPASCEGDVTGALTMELTRVLSGDGIPFFVDLIKFDEKENTGVVWHCGAAPSKLCRNFEETRLRLHMRVDGGDKKGVTNDFPLKAGRITLAKFDTDFDGRMRMLIATGEAIDTPPFLRGNPLVVRFDSPVKQLIDTIIKKGFEHHYVVIHADVADALALFSEWFKIEIVRV